MKKVKPVGGSYCMSDGTTEYKFHFSGGSIDPFDLAAVMQNHLNEEQTKPKTNSDLIFGPNSGEYVKQGIKTKSTMKEKDLLPFDLEEAKKDPSRVRFTDKAIAKEIHIFYNGRVSAVWEDGDFAIYADYTKLRLTPKRRFVTIFNDREGNKYFGKITNTQIVGEPGARHIEVDGLFELIPVKEDE